MDRILLIGMDVLMLFALGFTMMTMRKMTSHIKVIREGKTELQQLLQQLNIHISNAQHAIEGMKKLSDDKAKILQKQIDGATATVEELQFIQRAAENVAQRLEKLTSSGPPAAKPEDKPAKGKIAPARHASKAEKDLAEALSARRNIGITGE